MSGTKTVRPTIATLVAGGADEVVYNAASAKRWLYLALEVIGSGFHPDTSGSEYRDRTNLRTFTDEQAFDFDRRLDLVFHFVRDPSELCVDGCHVNVQPDVATAAAQHADPRVVKVHGCGARITVDGWFSLEPAYDDRNEFEWAEYRHCPCQSTISVTREVYKWDPASGRGPA